jgi:RNA polymerase sigma-70 factor (ECF subfamily)
MLVRAVLAGEKAAYKTLYDRYAPLVRAVCYDAIGNLTEAQDLAQDVFVRAYEKLGQLRDPARFGKWLLGIARPPDDSRIELLRKMITTLPEKERLALHTFYLQGN